VLQSLTYLGCYPFCGSTEYRAVKRREFITTPRSARRCRFAARAQHGDRVHGLVSEGPSPKRPEAQAQTRRPGELPEARWTWPYAHRHLLGAPYDAELETRWREGNRRATARLHSSPHHNPPRPRCCHNAHHSHCFRDRHRPIGHRRSVASFARRGKRAPVSP